MLHPDVLVLLHHFGHYVEGPILELGPYSGGSTIALAKGLVARKRPSRIVSVERGGSYAHPTLASDDILADLKKNLQGYDVADVVEIVEGVSRDPQTVEEVKRRAGNEQFGLLVIDADGCVQQDLSVYRSVLCPDAYLVVDDFYAPGCLEKEATTSAELNALERDGVVRSFGVYGWGTWLGRLC